MFKNMMSSAAKISTKLTKDHLTSEAIVMIVAGTDTTASTLALSLHHLLQQPEVYRKLQDEIRTVMPTLDSRPPIEELDSLPFLDACIKEGLRISCPSRVRLPRTVPEGGWTFKGHYFPAGVRPPIPLLSFVVVDMSANPSTENRQPFPLVFSTRRCRLSLPTTLRSFPMDGRRRTAAGDDVLLPPLLPWNSAVCGSEPLTHRAKDCAVDVCKTIQPEGRLEEDNEDSGSHHDRH
jgi:hypothetical protein